MAHECHGGRSSAEQLPVRSAPIWPYNLEMTDSGQPVAHISHPITGEPHQLTPANTSLLFDDRTGAPSQCIIHEQAHQSFLYDTLSNQVWDFELGAGSARHQSLMRLLSPGIEAYAYHYLDDYPGLLPDGDLIDLTLSRLNRVVSLEVARLAAEYITANCEDLSPVILHEINCRRPAQLDNFEPADPPQLRKAVNRLAYAYSGSTISLQLGDYFDGCLEHYSQQKLASQFVQATRLALDNRVFGRLADILPGADLADAQALTVGSRQLFSQLVTYLGEQAANGSLSELLRLNPDDAHKFLRRLSWDGDSSSQLPDQPILLMFYEEATEISSGFWAQLLGQLEPATETNFKHQLELIRQQQHLFEFSEDFFEVLLANQFPYRYNEMTVIAKPAKSC